jgi:hypothetical protein
MKVRSLLLALALSAASASAAHAQGAVYITPVFDRVSISPADTNPTFSFLGPTTTSRFFYGVQIGGYYDLPLQTKKYEVGIDLRDAILHGNSALLNSFLVGPRIAFVLNGRPRLHPYVEPYFGAGSTHAPQTAVRVTKIQYGVEAGADYDLSKRVGFRVFEVGYSGLSTAGSGTVGRAGAPQSSSNIINFSTGLIFRLP